MLAYLAVHGRPHAGHIWPLVASYLALALPLGLLHRLSRTDRLTAAGAALAARSGRLPDADRPDGARRPESGWSAVTGGWRLVGDEAWLLNLSRTVVVRVGADVAR